MVKFPPEFVKLKFPGYFWNVNEKKLYSIKVDGILKPLHFSKGGTFHFQTIEPGYVISVGGVKRRLPLSYLHTITVPETDQTIDIYK